jgi:hypothetical protein
MNKKKVEKEERMHGTATTTSTTKKPARLHCACKEELVSERIRSS